MHLRLLLSLVALSAAAFAQGNSSNANDQNTQGNGNKPLTGNADTDWDNLKAQPKPAVSISAYDRRDKTAEQVAAEIAQQAAKSRAVRGQPAGLRIRCRRQSPR